MTWQGSCMSQVWPGLFMTSWGESGRARLHRLRKKSLRGQKHTSGAKARTNLNDLTARLKRLRKKYLLRRSLTPAAKADIENRPVIAALKRCATQNHARDRVFPRPVNPCPSQNPRESEFFRGL